MRVSVTDLAAFRRYRKDEDFPLETLLRQLRREDPPTVAMRAGTAFHKILEQSPEKAITINRVKVDGFAFDFSNLEAEIDLAPVREVRCTLDYEIGGDIFTLSGRVDGLYGVTVDDHKLTSQFDAERYADSYQWRCYLAMLGADRFRYNTFVAKIDASADPEADVEVDVREFHQLILYRYPGIDEDVRREMELYVEFAKAHLWTKVVTRFKQEKTA